MELSSDLKERKEKSLKHLFDGHDLNVYDKNVLNLGVGAPGPDLLANTCDMFRKATEHRMCSESSSESFLFQYGPSVGTYEIRSQIANYLQEAYKSRVFCEDIVITTGATQGLHLILSTLIDMNGCIFVDEVTYLIAIDVFKQFPSMKVIPVKLQENGVDCDHLEHLLSERKFQSKDKLFWAFYYAIPTYHNPTGIIFSDDICKKLITIARKYDILIACDDVYNILHYKHDAPPKRLFAYDVISDSDYKGNVVSNGSFSKIIGPGVRLGWIEAPPRCQRLFDYSGVLRSGGCANQYTSGIMASLFQLGLAQSHIAFLYKHYKERMLAVCDVLKQKLPKSCSFVEPEGGYFIWIKLPEHVDCNDLLAYCLDKYKVFFLVGDRFSVEQKFKNCLRISIAFHPKESLEKGARDICAAIDEFLGQL